MPLMTLKIAVFAPTATPMVISVTRVNVGDRIRRRIFELIFHGSVSCAFAQAHLYTHRYGESSDLFCAPVGLFGKCRQ